MDSESPLQKDFSDKDFDLLFPPKITGLSSRHWTPVSVIRQAANFLISSPETTVLDIGSGSGKFCLVGALHKKGHFFGVEKRLSLVHASRKVARELSLEERVSIIHANVENINFHQYDAFYFFNSFHENLDTIDAIDKDKVVDEESFDQYTHYVREQLASMPIGTKIATYCSESIEIPDSYKVVRSYAKGKLLCWEKIMV